MKTKPAQTYIDQICGMTVSPETARGEIEFEGNQYYFCSKSCLETFKNQNNIQSSQVAAYKEDVMLFNKEGTHVDPICKMRVSPETAAGKYEYDGETVYFCSKGCLEKYKRQIENPAEMSVPLTQISRRTKSGDEDRKTVEQIKIDPVCGMSVAPDTAAGKYEFENETYYFCSEGCLNKFRQNPKIFLEEKKEQQLEANSEGVEYTCPMHPEIVQIGPGSCPICGMALEPKVISLDDKPDPELIDMTRRFWISAALTIPVFVLAMGEMLPNFHSYVSPKLSIWIQFILATLVVLWGGFPFFQRGWASIKNVSPNMFTLIAIGTSAAFIFSFFALFTPDLFPISMRNEHTGLIAAYFEAAAVITTLVLLGQVLELRARSQTSSAIKALLGLAPETAIVVFEDGTETEISLKDVQIGAK